MHTAFLFSSKVSTYVKHSRRENYADHIIIIMEAVHNNHGIWHNIHAKNTGVCL